jgi:hypothetical protein
MAAGASRLGPLVEMEVQIAESVKERETRDGTETGIGNATMSASGTRTGKERKIETEIGVTLKVTEAAK